MGLRAFLILVLLSAVSTAQEAASTRESDWKQRFEDHYRLADDEVLKRIPPPYVPERETYYQVELREQAQEPPDYFTFHFDGQLHHWGHGFIGRPLTLRGVMMIPLGMKSFELDGPKELLEIKIPGDWVVRTSAEPPQLVEAFTRIVNAASNRNIEIQQQELTREVIVVSGVFEFHPMEGTYDKRWVHLFVDDKDPDESYGGGSGNLDKFCGMLGSQVNMPMVNDIEGKQPLSISWGHHKSSYMSKLPPGKEKSEKVRKLLDVVSEQTSLKFSIEERPVQVWVISEKPVSSTSTSSTNKSNADVEALAKEFDARLRRSRYMESKDVRDVKIPGWDGFPTRRYTYSVTDKNGTVKKADVVMLNPSAEQISQWIVSALVEVKGKYDAAAGRKIFNHILGQSGGQFPVAGVVYEDIIPADGKNEVYCFRDGVTVEIEGVKHRTTEPLSAKEIETSIDGKVMRVFTYARIQSTSPPQWIAAGGAEDVLKDGKPTQKWLDAVREAYQKAWKSPRNELLVAWVKANVK